MTANSPPPLGPHGTAPRQSAADLLDAKWANLLRAADVVAVLADRPAQGFAAGVRHLPETMRAAGGWRLAWAAQGVDDLAIVMEQGLAALLAIHARGADTAPAAEALWDEFTAAEAALAALLPPR
jgi:hypothetical protein